MIPIDFHSHSSRASIADTKSPILFKLSRALLFYMSYRTPLRRLDVNKKLFCCQEKAENIKPDQFKKQCSECSLTLISSGSSCISGHWMPEAGENNMRPDILLHSPSWFNSVTVSLSSSWPRTGLSG